MKINVFIPKGIKYDENIDYAVVVNEDGEFAIMKNHTPIIVASNEGYIKITLDKKDLYIFVKEAVTVFDNNILKCYALNAEIGKTKAEAKENYYKTSKDLNQISKGEDVDYSKLEKDLRESIISAGAGHI